MIADPSVSRRKFEREVAAALAHKPFLGQGIWILRAEYPVVFAAIITTQKMPLLRGVLCGVHIDFTDYDVRPPSVKFVDPFTELPLNFAECWKFYRFTQRAPQPGEPTGLPYFDATPMLQQFDMNKPFLCLQGIREYHEASAHTGDSWFLHRRKNMLIHILTILQKYGSNSVGHQIQLVPTLAAAIT